MVDTGDQLSAVTRTRTPWRWGSAKDRRKLKGINRRYLRPPKSATAADDVTETAMKSCIHTHPTHLDKRPLRPPKLNNAVLVCSSFGGLRGLRACEGPLRLLVAVPMTISAAVAVFGGRGRLRRPKLVLQKAQTSVVIGGIVDTGDTGDNIFPRCRWYRSEITKRPKIYRRCQWHRRKTVHRCQRHRRIESPAYISLPSPKNEK